VAIGYLATALAGVSVWLLLEYVIGVHSGAVIFVAIPVVTIGFGVWFSRYAKLIWLAVDLAIHPPTQEDFQARGREGGQRAPTTPSEGDDADA
jgi:hypothetical protein